VNQSIGVWNSQCNGLAKIRWSTTAIVVRREPLQDVEEHRHPAEGDEEITEY